MKLPNPNQKQEFDRTQGDYGYRTVDGQEEIVHIPSGRSNMSYYQREMVLDSSSCDHDFRIIDVGKREVECGNCFWTFSFHAGRNFHEVDGRAYITIRSHKFSVSL